MDVFQTQISCKRIREAVSKVLSWLKIREFENQSWQTHSVCGPRKNSDFSRPRKYNFPWHRKSLIFSAPKSRPSNT